LLTRTSCTVGAFCHCTRLGKELKRRVSTGVGKLDAGVSTQHRAPPARLPVNSTALTFQRCLLPPPVPALETGSTFACVRARARAIVLDFETPTPRSHQLSTTAPPPPTVSTAPSGSHPIRGWRSGGRGGAGAPTWPAGRCTGLGTHPPSRAARERIAERKSGAAASVAASERGEPLLTVSLVQRTHHGTSGPVHCWPWREKKISSISSWSC
jgi:hypothetical protein